MLLNEKYQKWIWIELIGFDNTLPDLGVKTYLDRCGFIPDGVSLLLTWMEAVLSYKGLDTEYELAACEQSYGGHMYSPERKRQDWTNYQLKKLIDILHSYNIKVFISYFNMYVTPNKDNTQNIMGSFVGEHLYLNETSSSGSLNGSVNVLKNLNDGTPFEDVLQQKTVEVLSDYNFDGIQIADGISSYRLSLQYGDYSDNMVDQFINYSGIELQFDDIKQRAEYIWSELREEWINFHVYRWNVFYDKFSACLKAAGKEAIFNSAWTRDPFEAIYRYGVDYRSVNKKGLFGCMVEDTSAGLAILSDHDNGYLMTDSIRRRVHYRFLTTLMMNRAAMPDLKIIPLAGIHDTNEQWGVLEHMPTSLLRNVACNLNTLFFDGKTNKYKSITDGPYFCLSDYLYTHDWNFIKNCWNLAMPEETATPYGITFIWSDKRLDNEISAFIKTRRTPSYQLVSELIYAGMPVFSIARIEDLSKISGNILITNPDLLPSEEYEMIKNYKNGKTYYIGEKAEGNSIICEVNNFENIYFGSDNYTGHQSEIKNDKPYDFDPKYSYEKLNMLWTHPIDYKPVSDEFYKNCAKHVITECNLPEIEHASESCEMIVNKFNDKHFRVILSNDEYYYTHPSVNMKAEIASVKCLTKYDGYPLYPMYNTYFQCRIPGRGSEIFDVFLK